MKRLAVIIFLLFLCLNLKNHAQAIETIPSPPVKLIIKQNDMAAPETNADVPSEEELEEEAIEEDDKIINNSDIEFAEIETLEKAKTTEEVIKVKEDTLFQKIYKMKVEQTDVPSYLLKDYLTFEYDKGPMKKVQFYGAYRGNISSIWQGNDYDTKFANECITLGVLGVTAEKNTGFIGLFNIVPHQGRDYIRDFIADAYFVNSSIPNHKILLGVSRNQIGVEGGQGQYTLPFFMRSQISRNFASTRALGVRIVGDYPLVNYSLAMNSSDRFFRDFFPGMEFTGWVNFMPLGKTDGRYGHLTIGGGLNAGRNVENYTVAGAYIGYKYKRLFANIEYAAADGYNGSYVNTNKASGLYSTLAYKLSSRLQVLARADYFDPNCDVENDSKEEYTLGLNYFIKGQALRLILNYVFCHNQNQPDSNRVLVGTQILI